MNNPESDINIEGYYKDLAFEEKVKEAVALGNVSLSIEAYDKYIYSCLSKSVAENEGVSAKYRVVCLIANLATITIDKGFSPYSVKAKSDAMISLLDKQTLIEEIVKVGRLAVKGFSSQVATIPELDIYPDIKKALVFIHDHINDKLSISEVARVSCMSESYFSKIFKESTGSTFSSYVNKVKVDKSKAFLIHSDRSISDISYVLGFSNHSYYATVFKRLIGKTPQEYRNQFQGQLIPEIEAMFRDSEDNNP